MSVVSLSCGMAVRVVCRIVSCVLCAGDRYIGIVDPFVCGVWCVSCESDRVCTCRMIDTSSIDATIHDSHGAVYIDTNGVGTSYLPPY
jgi:hypothetical protein